ncbi:MAG: hypothetical protein HUU50_18400 [Candidatus Brocadiae bacterium]|nr:hypothetical protein [Candidatus Brocadiia bacterium]
MSEAIHLIDVIEKIVEQKLRSLYLGEIGIVTSVFPHKDPGDKENYSCHVKLKNPDAQGNYLELYHVPIATGHIGTVCIPNIDDMVLISFVGGSIHSPVVIARLYTSEMRPPVSTNDEIITQLPPGEKKPEEIIHCHLSNSQESKGPRLLEIAMKPMIEMTASTKDQKASFVLKVNEEKNKISIQHEEKGQIEISSQKTSIILKEDGDITISSPENITIKSKKDLMLEAQNITLKASGNIAVSAGGNFESTSQKSQKHEAQISMEISGQATTKVKSAGAILVQGQTISLG